MADETINMHILRTKLQRPPVASDILPRARLLDRLNEGRQRTLTLISAPAGYGKSTLASRWVSACDSPNGWVSLDERDSDLRTFLSYFLAAIRSLFPKTELRTEALLEATHFPSPVDVARYLLNDLHQIMEPFIVVLDDYHHIQRGSHVHDLVTEILAYPPQAMHLVLLTRRDPSLPIARLRGRGQMTEIRTADLRFTLAETAGFLSKMLKVPLNDATVALLEKKTEGWVTGLRLAGLYLRGEDDLKQRVQELSGSSKHITQYLVSEVLARQHPDIAAFLVKTSILDRYCAPLCQALHLRGAERRNGEQDFDAQRFIDWLVEGNIFAIPLDDQGYWFRYHHLFQEFLQNLLRKQTNDETIAGLHMQASNWLADNGLIDEAVRHALAAGNTDAAIHLVVAHRYDLMNNSQFIRLRYLLELLPANAAAATSLLVSARAFIGIDQGEDMEIYNCTDQARRMLEKLSSKSEEYATLKSEMDVVQGFIDMATGNPDSALAHAEDALNSPSLSEAALMIRSLGTFTVAVSHQMQGNAVQAVRILSEELLRRAWPPNLRARMYFSMAISHYLDTDLSGVTHSCNRCLQIIQDLPFVHTRTFAHYLLGAVYYLRNDVAEAESHLQVVLDNCEASNPSYVSNAGFIMACIKLNQGYTEQAEQILNRIELHFKENGYDSGVTMTQGFRAEFALMQGDVQKARQLSRDVDFDFRPPLWFFYVPQLTPIKLLLAEGTDRSLKEARARLFELDEQMGRIHRKSVRIDVVALLALVCHKMGEEAAALENLQTALALAEPGGWVRNFVDLGGPMTDLLERLNQAKPGHTYALQVLVACKADAQNNMPSDPNAEQRSRLAGQAAVRILSNRETEILQLLAEGLSNKEIASRLYIATETVKTHVQNVYRKLDAKGRMAAVIAARTLGLIPND